MHAATLNAPSAPAVGLARRGQAGAGHTFEAAGEQLRLACRRGRLDGLSQAAAALLPLTDPGSPRRSIMRDLAVATPAPATPPGEGRVWLLRRVDGSMVGLYRLRDDGTVGLDPHPNEARWRLRDGALELHDPAGVTSTRFTLSARSGERRLHVGLFKDGHTLHVLSEVDCHYSKLRMLDPELLGAFCGLYPPSQLAEATLPETPAVLLAAPRTGSHLLLNSSGHVFFDAELHNLPLISLFGGDIRGQYSGALYSVRASDPVYFSKVMMTRSHHTDGRGFDDIKVRGFKLFPQQARPVMDWVIDEPAMRIVHLHRANLLAEFSSLLVAQAEGHWVGGPESLKRHRIAFDPARFRAFVQMKQAWLAMLRERLARRAGDAIEIEYSAFSHESVNQVLSFLLQAPTHARLNALGLKRQLNERVIDRFDDPDAVMRCLDAMGHEAWAGVEAPAVVSL